MKPTTRRRLNRQTAGVVVVSRLRKDAGLRTVPASQKKGVKGGKRKYGKKAISLVKEASKQTGWKKVKCVLYGGKTVTKTCKTFLATYPVVGGRLRVVLVKEGKVNKYKGWEVFFCIAPDASVQEILAAYADRSSIEQVFHDVKEVWGVAQQQLRNVWSNLGAFHLNLWSHTLVELWSWSRGAGKLRDRSQSPWDDCERRPSHADRRKALRRETMNHEIKVTLGDKTDTRQIKKLLKNLLQLAA